MLAFDGRIEKSNRITDTNMSHPEKENYQPKKRTQTCNTTPKVKYLFTSFSFYGIECLVD